MSTNLGAFVNLRNLSLSQSLCNASSFNQWLRHLLAWTCIWQDEQQSSRLVPSSPMWELVGGGSELHAPTLKHISGISGRVRLPWRGKEEKHEPEEVASFDGYEGVKEKNDSDWTQVPMKQNESLTANVLPEWFFTEKTEQFIPNTK